MLSKAEAELARTIGQRIRELREERGWDQIDLEAHIDSHVRRATISNFETGSRLPSMRTLQRLALAFDVETAELLLKPNQSLAHRTAIAVLSCSKTTLTHVAKLLDLR